MKVIKKIGLISLTTAPIMIGSLSLVSCNEKKKESEVEKVVVNQNKKAIDSLTSNTLKYENNKAVLDITLTQEEYTANLEKLMGMTTALGFDLQKVMAGEVKDKDYTLKMHNDSVKSIKEIEPLYKVLNLKEVTELNNAKITIVLDQTTLATTTTIVIGDYSLEYKINLPSFS